MGSTSSVGMHWDVGSYDFRLFLLGGPVIGFAENTNVGFRGYASGEFKIPFGKFHLLAQTGVGFGVYSNTTEMMVNVGWDANGYVKRTITVGDEMEDFFFIGAGIGYQIVENLVSIGSKARLHVGISDNKIAKCKDVPDHITGKTVEMCESEHVGEGFGIGLSWNIIEIDFAF